MRTIKADWKPEGRVTRKCGTCTMCCTALPIIELNKPPGVDCRHLRRGEGCTIYDDRPKPCRLYACLWLWGRGSIDARPDRMGALPTMAHSGAQLAMYLKPGVDPNTLPRVAMRFVRDWWKRFNTAVLLIHGDGYNTTTAIFPDGHYQTKPTNWIGALPPSMLDENGELKP